MGKEDNAINYFNKRIKSWLQEEIEHNEPVVSGIEEMADGTDDIFIGRTQLAKSLLQKLDEWDEETDNGK